MPEFQTFVPYLKYCLFFGFVPVWNDSAFARHLHLMNQFRVTEIERRVMTPEAVAFLNDLEQEFGWRRGRLLAERQRPPTPATSVRPEGPWVMEAPRDWRAGMSASRPRAPTASVSWRWTLGRSS